MDTEKMPENQDQATDNKTNEKFEQVKGKGQDLLESLKKLLHEGNIRRVIIKGKEGNTIAEFPLTFGLIGALAAPIIASIGTIIALVSECSIYVEKK